MAAFLVALFAVLGVAGWEAAYDFIDDCIFYALLFVLALALWQRARQHRMTLPAAADARERAGPGV